MELVSLLVKISLRYRLYVTTSRTSQRTQSVFIVTTGRSKIREICCLFKYYMKLINAVCGQTVRSLLLNQAVDILTTKG